MYLTEVKSFQKYGRFRIGRFILNFTDYQVFLCGDTVMDSERFKSKDGYK